MAAGSQPLSLPARALPARGTGPSPTTRAIDAALVCAPCPVPRAPCARVCLRAHAVGWDGLQVGSQCIKCVTQEIKKYADWEVSMAKKQKRIKAGKYKDDEVKGEYQHAHTRAHEPPPPPARCPHCRLCLMRRVPGRPGDRARPRTSSVRVSGRRPPR